MSAAIEFLEERLATAPLLAGTVIRQHCHYAPNAILHTTAQRNFNRA